MNILLNDLKLLYTKGEFKSEFMHNLNLIKETQELDNITLHEIKRVYKLMSNGQSYKVDPNYLKNLVYRVDRLVDESITLKL